jgi:hypothetical protein
MRFRSDYLVLIILFIGLLAPFAAPIKAITPQYQTLASFDFLSASEVANFVNTTLSGEAWNSWNTTQYGQLSYSVANGKLNITSTSGSVGSKEGLLLYPVSWKGYVEVTLTQGVIAALNPANSSSVLSGFEVVKTSSGVTVYEVNGSSKTALASLTTTQNVIVVTVDGGFKVNLGDGTGVYSGGVMDYAVLGLGAEGGSSGIFDKVVLYGQLLAGNVELDLGTQTVTPAARIAAFNYDVSKYSDIQAAKLIISFTRSNDMYARYYIVSTSNPGNVFWGASKPASYLDFNILFGDATIEVDVTSTVTASATGTFYIGVSVGGSGSWSISAKLVLDAPTSSQDSSTTTEQPQDQGLWDQLKSKWNSLSPTTKYLLLGIGIIFIIVLIMFMMQGGFMGRKRGIAAILGILIIILILGGIATAFMAWLHPEYLTAMAFGLGAIAIIALFLILSSNKNPHH